MKVSKSILLVDDDPDDQLFFIEALEEIKHVTLHGIASNGIEALEKLKDKRFLPDMIFMDINMPKMNGIECLTEIMKNPQLNSIPVIILSTATGQKEITINLGAKAFIKKPSNGVLKEILEKMVNMEFIINNA